MIDLAPPPLTRAGLNDPRKPDEAADDPGLLRELLRRGTDAVRINCIHGTSTEWDRMIGHLRDAEREAGRLCRMLIDLAGGDRPSAAV